MSNVFASNIILKIKKKEDNLIHEFKNVIR